MGRVLKVKAVGDFYKKKDVPQISLQGRWLEKAGIEKGDFVVVENPEPGILVVKIKEMEGVYA